MYKLVIVEDENDVRRRINRMIGSYGETFQVVSEYETGIDAYDGIISDNPDLVLTDIKIPYINGIELAKMIREVLPFVKIIFITGYSEFEYAKEAANLGVVGFISKPVTYEDLSTLLDKAKTELEEEYLTTSNINKLSDFYQSSLPIIRENYLYRLSGMSDISPAFENSLKSYGVDLDYPYFMICVFDFDTIREGEEERCERVFSSIKNILAEELNGGYAYESFKRYEKLCFIFKFHTSPDIPALDRIIERIITRISRYSDMSVSAGLSGVYDSKNFAAMQKEAIRALRFRAVMGGGNVFFDRNITSSGSKLAADDSMVKELGYMLNFKPLNHCFESIDYIWEHCGDADESRHFIAFSILNVLIKACDSPKALYTLYNGAEMLYRRLFETPGEEIPIFLKELARIIRDLNDNVLVDNVEHNFRKIVAYMETHYCDPDISFESLANEVKLSVSYISALLKRKLNTSFIKMLTGLRMEKAKELLADPSLKIIDVAERLGYNDSYYFSHCFKKNMGISPKEFKSNEQR